MKFKITFFLLIFSASSITAQNPKFQYFTIPLSEDKSWMDILGIRKDDATKKTILATYAFSQKDDLKPATKTDHPFDINYAANYVNRNKFNEILKKVEPNPGKVSYVISPGLCSKEISLQIIQTMRVVGFDLKADYPGFKISESKVHPRLKYVDYSTSPVNPLVINYLPLNKEQNAQTLPFYTEEEITAYPIDNEKFVGIAGDVRKDSWDQYMKKKFITFNYKGEIIGVDSINFKYLRQLSAVVPVFNTTGNKTSFFFIFGKQSAVGKKSLKDPEADRFNIVVIGMDGKIVGSFESMHASGYYPLDIKTVIEKEGKYYAFNRNLKSISKVTYEQIIYDKSGKTDTVITLTLGQVIELVKPGPGSSTLIESGNYFMMIPTPSGHYYMIGQTQKSEKNATTSETANFFHGITMLELDNDFRPARYFTAALPKSSYPAIVDLVQQNGDALDLVITAPGAQNLVCQIRPTESEGYEVKPSVSLMPLCGYWGMNYILDASRNELQFYYLPERVSMEAQMVSVPLKK